MTIKPAPWAVNRAAVAPEYQGLWRDLISLAPVWGSTSLSDVVRKVFATPVGSPTMEIAEIGTVFENPGSDAGADFSTLPIPTGDFAWAFLVKRTGASASNARLFHGSSAFNDFSLREDGSNLRVQISGISAPTDLDFGPLTTVLPLDEWRLVTLSHRTGSQEGWLFDLNGELVSTASHNSTGSYTGSNGIVLGSSSNVQFVALQFALFSMWSRFVEFSEFQRLTGDPFALIRPATVLEVDIGPHVFFDITDLPADFGNAESATITVRTRGVDIGATPLKLFAQLFQSDESTTMSDEVECVAISSDDSFTNYTVSLTGLNTSSGKSVWDNARIRFRWGT